MASSTQPRLRASDPRLDQIEADIHKLITDIAPILVAYNAGTFPGCALEQHKVNALYEEVSVLKKKLIGNGTVGIEMRLDRVEKIARDVEALKLDVTIDRLTTYVENQKRLFWAFALVLIGQISLTVWQHFFS